MVRRAADVIDMAQNWKRLGAAIRRRDRGEQPLAWDNEVLSERGLPLNPLPQVVPKEPRTDSLPGRLLRTLRNGAVAADQLAEEIGISEEHVRAKIGYLRRRGHRIENDWAGRFHAGRTDAVSQLGCLDQTTALSA